MVGRAYTVFGPDIYLNALEGVPPGAVWVQGACCPPRQVGGNQVSWLLLFLCGEDLNRLAHKQSKMSCLCAKRFLFLATRKILLGAAHRHALSGLAFSYRMPHRQSP